jgi:hypothetical protein
VSADFPGHHPDDFPGAIPGDLLGDIMASEPGLDALLGMLTAGPAPDELTGEAAALAMFRANRHPDASEPDIPGVPGPGAPAIPGPRMPGAPVPEPTPGGPPVPAPRIPGPRSFGRRGRRAGLMAAAVTLAAAAGFVVAAYTATLPAPLQQAAYHALGFAGVPSAGHHPPSSAASRSPRPARGHGPSPGPGHSQQPGAPASPQPGVSSPAPGNGQDGLSITASSGRIVAGGKDTFAGHLTGPAGAVAGVSLSLLERAAGQGTWSVAGTAKTNSGGSAVLSVPDLTTNAVFRLNGPGGALSRPVLVIVLPPMSASVTSSSAHAVVVSADSPLAVPGNTVVLQLQFGARWLNVQKGQLNRAGKAEFVVHPRAKPSVYRVVLLPTASHGLSVSNTVTVSPR